MLFLQFFNHKVSLLLFVVDFLCIRLAGSHICLPGSQLDCGRGRGGSHRESSQLPIVRLRVIYNSQLHGYTLLYSHPY